MSLILGLLILYHSCVYMHSLVYVHVQENFVFMDYDNFGYKDAVTLLAVITYMFLLKV